VQSLVELAASIKSNRYMLEHYDNLVCSRLRKCGVTGCNRTHRANFIFCPVGYAYWRTEGLGHQKIHWISNTDFDDLARHICTRKYLVSRGLFSTYLPVSLVCLSSCHIIATPHQLNLHDTWNWGVRKKQKLRTDSFLEDLQEFRIPCRAWLI
jgi:hypothetical protein